RGHGLSKDSSRPWSFEVFADDVAALMGHLGIKKASVMGYSSGADVALQTAIRHPQLVDKLIVISTGFRSDGYYPEVLKAFAADALGSADDRGRREQIAARITLSVRELGNDVQEDW
ncbi:MAG: alpha/beta fold hydrolase, partial [Gemmatimonadaceae bacterium]